MVPRPETLWIVHAEPAARAAIERLAGASRVVRGAPGELPAEGAPEPRAVILHVGPDLSVALDFAHRTRLVHPRAGFVLLRDESVPTEVVAEAFADLDAEVLAWPSDSGRLATAVQQAGRNAPAALRARRERDALVRRFARLLGDLGLPDLGGLARGRLLIRGEPGTGKLLAARVVHALGEPAGAFVHVVCARGSALRSLGARLSALGSQPRVVICLERPEQLAPEEQRELAAWIELGPPGTALDPERCVWIALLEEIAGASPRLEPSLALALAGHDLSLRPLRERPDVAERFSSATLRGLAEATAQPARALSEAAVAKIRSAPWPENFRELEAVLRRAAARGGSTPIGPDDLELAEATPLPEPPAERATAPAKTVAPRPRAAEPTSEPARAPATAPSRSLLQALAHSLRNPLVSLETFSKLLPEQFADPDFRGRFRAQTGRDLEALERHLDRLARFAELRPGPAQPVNVAGLLEALLQERRNEIQRRRLLVLSELGAEAPWALGSEAVLRFVFASVFDAVFAQIRDRQDLYLACRRHSAAPGGAPRLRVLLRFHGTPFAWLPGPGRPRPASLELALAETALEPLGGRIACESADGDEQVVRVDLPAAQTPG